jgi:hypothetical protein
MSESNILKNKRKEEDKKKELQELKREKQNKIQAKIEFKEEHKPQFQDFSSHKLFFDEKMLEGLMENNLG